MDDPDGGFVKPADMSALSYIERKTKQGFIWTKITLITVRWYKDVDSQERGATSLEISEGIPHFGKGGVTLVTDTNRHKTMNTKRTYNLKMTKAWNLKYL